MSTSYCFGKAKPSHKEYHFKKLCSTPNLLKPRYKYTKTVNLIATHIQNSNCYSYKYGKNILYYYAVLQTGDIWHSQSKNFVSWAEQNNYLLMSCFKIVILKSTFPENKAQVHLFGVSVFVTLLIESLSFFVSDYNFKIKENTQSL